MINWNLDPEVFPAALKHCAASIGNFDGVHLGHAEIVRRLKTHGLPTVVFTFSPHPRQILHPENAPDLLTWPERKVELLKALGADEIVVCPTREILEWTPEEFFDRVIVRLLNADVLVEGPNFHFGKGREGNTQRLGQLCTQSGRILEVVEALHELNGISVSSSRIRDRIADGAISEANALLTAPYRIRGSVIHGEARGRTLGFPTANLGSIENLLPASGVYACRAILPDGNSYPAAVHVGPNVTFQEQETKVEIHLLDFCGCVYGSRLQVEFLERLRDLVSFESREALRVQIAKDVQETRRKVEEMMKKAQMG